MNTWHGYTGKILDVDLTSAVVSEAELDRSLAADYMGGKGFGAKILYDQLPTGCEPLSADNILVFATGPLTGTFAPSSGRFEVCTKSPATGLWLDSNCGGYFGPELKFAGYDMVIIRGKAAKPMLLVIDDNKFELKPADDLWGADAIATHRQIKDSFGRDFKVACIGPAGEKGVLFAAIISEYRALGRGGAGAVMGSKNLKAIAVRGNGSIPLFDPDTFMKTCRESFNELANSPDTGGGRQKYGTNVILSLMDEVGLHPVRNFQKGKFDGAASVNEEAIEAHYVRNKACFGCPIYCSKIAEVKEGKYKGSFTEGPEYENVWSFGANCENVDVGAIIQAEYLCDYYGLDAITAGNVIGFLMECVAKGLLPETDIGFPMAFGNDESIINAIHLIGKGQGPGKLWGQGVKKLAEQIEGAQDLAMHVKGLELPAYDPRGSAGMALAYATSDRGGCHLRSWPIGDELLATEGRMDLVSLEFKAELVKTQQDLFCMVNCSGMCLFATFAVNLKQITPFLHAATGLEVYSSSEEVMKIGERVNNLVRLFNIREGLTRDLDTLPKRFFNEPLKEGPSRNRVVELDQLMDEYYMVRGWDKEGAPGKEKLRALGI
ncbi:Tungsten-containing aldehyde:ferredoxin oxidoreductase (EC [Olavius sp. associated proteobacterium Delta 1]|nr:Tungsten-containing aldehyde:ferredoxin oxidoreductase (EC [Olavius sp. associated proteobacterium Delta 1]